MGFNLETLEDYLPAKMKNSILLKVFSFTQVPLLYYLGPTVEELTEDRCVMKIPLNRRSKNHLKSMYFGALAAGADIAAGYLALVKMGKMRRHFSFAFKDFHADFLKRAEGDTHFICEDGKKIGQKIEEAKKSGERINFPVTVVATCPSVSGNEPVAKFTLTMSMKAR